MRKMWWKYLFGLGLLVIVFLSLRTPLSPGILSVHDNELSKEDPTLSIIGYHTHFKSAEGLQVWLEQDGWTRCASSVTALDDTHLLASFDTQSEVPTSLLNLFINNNEDGTLLALNGVRTVDVPLKKEGLNKEKCYSPLTVTTHSHFTLPFRVILYGTQHSLSE